MIGQAVVSVVSVLAGLLAGHLLAARTQRIAWRREDAERAQTRQLAERIDFTVSVEFVVMHGDSWVVSLVASLNNRGQVKYETELLDFEVRCLFADDPLENGGPGIGGQLRVPHVLSRGSWLPADWAGTVIEPGLSTRYARVEAIPAAAEAVLVHGEFSYINGIHHSAECLQAVPPAAV